MRFLPATLVLGLALSGCAATLPQAEGPTAATPSPQVEALEEDDMVACGLLADSLIPVADIVSSIVEDGTGQGLDPAEVSRVADDLRAMLEVTTARMDAYAAPFASVVLLLDDIYEGRAEPNMTMDTGAYRDAAIGILDYCVNTVGYSKP